MMDVKAFCFSLCVCFLLLHRSFENEMMKVLEKVNENITQTLTVWKEYQSNESVSNEMQNCRKDFTTFFHEHHLNESSYSFNMGISEEKQYFNICFHKENGSNGVKNITKLCISRIPIHQVSKKAREVLGMTENTRGYLLKCTEVNDSPITSASSKHQSEKKSFPDSGWFTCGVAVGTLASAVVYCVIWKYNIFKDRKMEKMKKKYEEESMPIYHELEPINTDPCGSGHVENCTTFTVNMPLTTEENYQGRESSSDISHGLHRDTNVVFAGESDRDEHITINKLQEHESYDEISETKSDCSSSYFTLTKSAEHTVF